MSTLTAFLIVAAVVLPGGVLLLLGLCRAAGRASRAEEQRPPVDGYQGADSLRLLEDLDAHMQAYGNTVADLYDTTAGDRDA